MPSALPPAGRQGSGLSGLASLLSSGVLVTALPGPFAPGCPWNLDFEPGGMLTAGPGRGLSLEGSLKDWIAQHALGLAHSRCSASGERGLSRGGAGVAGVTTPSPAEGRRKESASGQPTVRENWRSAFGTRWSVPASCVYAEALGHRVGSLPVVTSREAVRALFVSSHLSS